MVCCVVVCCVPWMWCGMVCTVCVCLCSTEGVCGMVCTEEQQKEEVPPKCHCEQIFSEAFSTEAESRQVQLSGTKPKGLP